MKWQGSCVKNSHESKQPFSSPIALMKRYAVGFLFIKSLSCAHFIYHDFDDAMQIKHYLHAYALTNRVLNYDGALLYLKGKQLYEQLNPTVCNPGYELIIPKHIHQIWIGGPLPEVFQKYIATWKQLHPDWEYTLWTDAKVRELFPLYNQEFYDASENMGVKSDLLKWEIIYRFGGLYVDVDYECLVPLDELHYTYDFYTAFQPLDAFFVQLGAALFAARVHHPVLKHCIETISNDWHEKGAPKKSGPCHFSKSFMTLAGVAGSRDIAFPAFYFYPFGSQDRVLNRAQWAAEGAYAVHHWAKSWMPVPSRRPEFRTFDNEQSSRVWNE